MVLFASEGKKTLIAREIAGQVFVYILRRERECRFLHRIEAQARVMQNYVNGS